MDINIEYSAEEFVAVLNKTAELKIKLLRYNNNPLSDIIAIFIILIFFITGIKAEVIGHNILGTILIIVGVVLLMIYIAQSVVVKSKRRNLRNLSKKIKIEIGSIRKFRFTENGFISKSKEFCYENGWSLFTSFFETEDFIFLIIKGETLESAFFVSKKIISNRI